jgi:DNA-directed RNA polymerase specialized sigma24 family protein
MHPASYASLGPNFPELVEASGAKIVRNSEKKSSWQLTDSAWKQLLVWLDQGSDSRGQRYLEIRQRLVAFFDRKNCAMPDALADETLNRVARRLEEEERIETDAPAHYCYIVARYVFLESLRQRRLSEVSVHEIRHLRPVHDPTPMQADEGHEKRLDCLDQCVGRLDQASREIITRYYQGSERIKIENRRALAAELGLSANALTIRACRIRAKLESCVKQCAGD